MPEAITTGITWVTANAATIATIALGLLTVAEAVTTFTESDRDDAIVKKIKDTAVNLIKRFVPGWEK